MNLSFFLYLLMAISTAIANLLGTDDAAKYVEAEALFWAKGANGVIASIAIAMKAYTSQGFQEWINKKDVMKASP